MSDELKPCIDEEMHKVKDHCGCYFEITRLESKVKELEKERDEVLRCKEAYREIAYMLRLEIFERANAQHGGRKDLIKGIDDEAKRVVEGMK